MDIPISYFYTILSITPYTWFQKIPISIVIITATISLLIRVDVGRDT